MAMTIVHKGIKFAYEDRGAGRPAFVFVHGWTCDRSFFAPRRPSTFPEDTGSCPSTYAGPAKATSPRGHIPS
jgi:pimeloyl-ACP methyl ester carboxylesterase